VNNNCFGSRCPKPPTLDDSTSYHYVLNKDVPISSSSSSKRKWRRPNPLESRQDRSTKRSLQTHAHLSIPFIVDPSLPKNTRAYPAPSFSSSPGWVKLNPVLPDQYDLFTLKNTTPQSQISSSSSSSSQGQSSFSDRLGVELSPDSFADRWGWASGSSSGSLSPSSEGTRIPPWLQDIHNTRITNNNNNHNNNRYPSRDSDSKWVKLDPIPVVGVSISKWVAKGTPPEDLPSTNWPTRNHQQHQQQYRPQNSIPWWEQVDKQHHQRPSASSYGSQQIPSSPHRNRPYDMNSGWGGINMDKSPTNAWDEVVYPEGPTSATASWQKDKDFYDSPPKYGGGGYGNTIHRPPTKNYPPSPPSRYATGSWSADRHSSASSDDPRWVLVSNSRKVTVDSRPPLPSSLQVGTYTPTHLRPGFDHHSDFPFYERPSRNGKDFKGRLQDEAFSKINATLANLAPVLNLRGSKTKHSSAGDYLKESAAYNNSSSSNFNKLPAFLKPHSNEDGRAHNNNNNLDSRNKTVVSQFLGGGGGGGGGGGRKGLSINPVYAAVGAGMIPATMAAVLPMVLGRRRKRRSVGGDQIHLPLMYLRRSPPPNPEHRWWGNEHHHSRSI